MIALVNTAESHVVRFGYSCRRPASSCSVSYTVLMFVEVLAGQPTNVGKLPELQYGVTQQSFNTE